MNRKKFICCMVLAVIASMVALPALASADEPIKIVMIWDYRTAYHNWQEKLAKRFNESHSNIQIELVDSTTSIGSRMQTMLAAGVQLDIGYHDPYLINQWGKEGRLADLSPYMQRDRTYFASFYPASLNLFRSGSKLWGIPKDLQLYGVFYNKTIFSEAGLQYPGGANWTYQTLKDASVRLQRKNADGKTVRWGFKFPTWRDWVSIVWAHGADFLDNWNDPTRFIGNTSQMTSALQYIRDLETSGAIIDKANDASLPFDKAFRGQQIAMVQINTIVMGTFMDIPDFEWDVAGLPAGPAKRTTAFNAMGWMMFNTCKNKDAASEVLRYFNEQEAMVTMVSDMGVVPPDSRYINNWVRRLEKPANRTSLFDGIDNARTPGTLNNDLFNIIQNETNLVRWGEKSISSAITTMSELVKNKLAELYGIK